MPIIATVIGDVFLIHLDSGSVPHLGNDGQLHLIQRNQNQYLDTDALLPK